MQTLIRETLLGHLQEITTLADGYAGGDFAGGTMAWLKAVEDSLGKLRHPQASLAAAERARVAAAGDEPSDAAEPCRRSRRKHARWVAREALGRVEERLREEVLAIDARFAELRDKLAQAVAMAHAQDPLPLPPTQPREAWLRAAWRHCRGVANVAPLLLSLEAALKPMDRLNLLDDVLNNVLASE
ncbi:MAG: hypothetical protein P1V81_13505 [Planctomycetota bacterium]|nr:hypothetical protein [Planctomycetota bacterium]